MPSMTPTSIGGLRMTLPLVFIWFYLKTSGTKVFRDNLTTMLTASALNAFRLYFYFIAFIMTSVAAAVILFYCFPIFVALIGHYFLKERMSKKQWMYLILAFVGIIISYSNQSFSFQNEDFIGMSAALISGLGYAITVVLFKTQSENYTSTEMVFYQNLVGCIIFLPFFIFHFPNVSIQDIGICFLYSLLIGFVVFKLFFIGLKSMEASVASSIMYLEIVAAFVYSYLLLGERLSVNAVIGGAIIVLSSFMINRARLRS